MEIKVNNRSVIVFDLDDTLYLERDYVISGLRFVADVIKNIYNKDVLEQILKLHNDNCKDIFYYLLKDAFLPLSIKSSLIELYRYHIPSISPSDNALELIKKAKDVGAKIYIITDGRGITQRLKLTSLNLMHYFEHIYISEEVGHCKPSPYSFFDIMLKEGAKDYVYIADNPKKDFISPNKLGWLSIGIENTTVRIHELSNVQSAYKPHFWLPSLSKLNFI